MHSLKGQMHSLGLAQKSSNSNGLMDHVKQLHAGLKSQLVTLVICN